MEELFKNFDFNEETNYEIKEINGQKLPADYLEFMKEHNGGEGDVGKNSYMQILKLEELMDYNKDYEIFTYLPTAFAFGGDLGGNHFCYDFQIQKYFAIDCCSLEEKDEYCLADTFCEFIIKWDESLEEDIK